MLHHLHCAALSPVSACLGTGAFRLKIQPHMVWDDLNSLRICTFSKQEGFYLKRHCKIQSYTELKLSGFCFHLEAMLISCPVEEFHANTNTGFLLHPEIQSLLFRHFSFALSMLITNTFTQMCFLLSAQTSPLTLGQFWYSYVVTLA